MAVVPAAGGSTLSGRPAGSRVATDAFGVFRAELVRSGPLRPLAAVELVAEVGAPPSIAGTEPARPDALPVDPDAVGAVQVPDLQLVADRRQATMATRDAARVQPGVARRMATDQDHRLRDRDIGPLIQRQQSHL